MPPRKLNNDFRAVIFDMDGVIVDSEPRHAHAFFEVVREIGYGDTHGVNWDDYVGRSDHDIWGDFVAKHKPAQSLERLLEMKRDRVLEIIQRDQPVYAGLTELVERLARVCRLGLASGSDRPVVEAVLSLRDLRRHFSATVTASEVMRGKPAPEIFLRTAELLGVAPADCWVIEDSKPGVTAALAAGMRVIAITNTHPADELRRATVVVANYAEIERLLLGT
ncbi:MAG: HAD family phosphatase [Verrucomicrobiota bacterium]|nr:HAD family phosphatase [Verrucomicrobiota bacterium]MCC6821006.1 HAD family phosphatase [Limisphaerales bacterium]